MKLLLHICCAPCTIYPLRQLRNEASRIKGFFFNPNIHPYLEYRKRLDTLSEFARLEHLDLGISDIYPLEEFLQKTAFMGADRCGFCYEVRLRHAAKEAKKGLFDAFTTTLLFSRYQKHELIRSKGESIGAEEGIPFYYKDFRTGWEEGVRVSKEMGMYRQNYCGCIFSERDRFRKAKSKSV